MLLLLPLLNKMLDIINYFWWFFFLSFYLCFGIYVYLLKVYAGELAGIVQYDKSSQLVHATHEQGLHKVRSHLWVHGAACELQQ